MPFGKPLRGPHQVRAGFFQIMLQLDKIARRATIVRTFMQPGET
jgi:hypothetical protein